MVNSSNLMILPLHYKYIVILATFEVDDITLRILFIGEKLVYFLVKFSQYAAKK